MLDAVLQRAVPNEQWQLVLEFAGPEYRLFDTSIVREENGWHQLAYPQHVKRFKAAPDGIRWDGLGMVDAQFLHLRSRLLAPADLERQVLRLGEKNQAPTAQDARHHVYGVYLARFGTKPFRLGESIGGGMAERGGGCDLSLQELLAWPDWRRHFALSGCTWATALVEAQAAAPQRLLDLLVDEACRRNGMAEDG